MLCAAMGCNRLVASFNADHGKYSRNNQAADGVVDVVDHDASALRTR